MESTQGTILPATLERFMTKSQYAAISQIIAKQRVASSASKEAARESLLRSGLYNRDGSLKAAYGGKKQTSD